MTLDARALDRLVERADVLAGAWSARARASTTPGCERALLRLAGVSDLDRDGRPLAWAIVDRYLVGRPDRLPGGVLAAFAVAALEYELGPQELALDVAGGAIDLALEAELLTDPDRRASAEAEAGRWADAAFDRIDANRVARRDLLDVLGDAPQPWIGATIGEPEAEDAADEAAGLARAGVDLLRVVVPAGRELTDRLHAIGVDLEPWRPREPEPDRGRRTELVPAGSQRGLAALRGTLDEAAAARDSYVRVATSAPPLAAPEQAVVAAFERIDVVEADVMAEIVGGVDPDRALADHAFAQRLIARAGSLLVVGAGPLVVGPDLARGVPAVPAVLEGRAIALQLLAVALARHNGLSPAQVVVGAVPDWVADDRAAGVHAIAGAALRRRLFPGHMLAFAEPPASGSASPLWPFLVAAAIPAADGTALVLSRAAGRAASAAVQTLRAAVSVGASTGASGATGRLEGAALDHASAAVDAARELLDRIADEGWRAVIGEAAAPGGPPRPLAAGAVAERSDAFDPFAIPA